MDSVQSLESQFLVDKNNMYFTPHHRMFFAQNKFLTNQTSGVSHTFYSLIFKWKDILRYAFKCVGKCGNSRFHKKLAEKVINDFESGVKSDVYGTPTFFINGHKYDGFNDFESLYKACKFLLKTKGMVAE